ncbi:MAG: hypothetical protein IKP64_01860 [Selenomonadaceae bacterium]|nr:hypothetical protein [Selenomonadaceae bacterium]
MQCRRCGKELGNSLKCTFCGYENTEGNVRDLTRTEKHFFDGETIDVGSIDGQSQQEDFRDRRRYDYDFSTRRTFVHVDSGGIFSRAMGWILREWLGGNKLVKVAVTLILVAFAALMMFVALPIIFVILAAGIVILTLLNKFR